MITVSLNMIIYHVLNHSLVYLKTFKLNNKFLLTALLNNHMWRKELVRAEFSAESWGLIWVLVKWGAVETEYCPNPLSGPGGNELMKDLAGPWGQPPWFTQIICTAATWGQTKFSSIPRLSDSYSQQTFSENKQEKYSYPIFVSNSGKRSCPFFLMKFNHKPSRNSFPFFFYTLWMFNSEWQ